MKLHSRKVFVIRAAASVLSAWMLIVLVVAILLHVFAGIGGAGLERTAAHSPSRVSFLEDLYFAVVTTTTVGYGDYIPLGWFRVVASADAIVGVVMAGLLVARVTAELVDPWTLLKDAAGIWFDHVRIARKDGTLGEFVTLYTIEKLGNRWICSGTNFDLSGTYRHKFEAHVIGVDERTIYIDYHNDASAMDDFTSGIWVLTLMSSGDVLWYTSYSLDLKFGRRDETIAIKLHPEKDKQILDGLVAEAGSKAFCEAVHQALTRTSAIKPPTLPSLAGAQTRSDTAGLIIVD